MFLSFSQFSAAFPGLAGIGLPAARFIDGKGTNQTFSKSSDTRFFR